MKSIAQSILFSTFLGLASLALIHTVACRRTDAGPQTPAPVSRRPAIRPDYQGVTIPPNIAPLNFRICEEGVAYDVWIEADGPNAQAPIHIQCRRPQIAIPQKRWRTLLQGSRGESLRIHVAVQSPAGPWQSFLPLTFSVAQEEIDRYLVYRRMYPGHSTWRDIAIRQRNLTSFAESSILDNRDIQSGCMNCHAFCGSRSDSMLMAIRSDLYGGNSVMAQGLDVQKLGTKTGYAAWHPGGRLVVYSLNKVRQFFHSTDVEVRDVMDLDSSLVYYDLDQRAVRTAPAISRKDRLETYPAWSPDGATLYFSSAPLPWTDKEHISPSDYQGLRYNLVKTAYDAGSDTWGDPETILAAHDTGRSALLPRISPDGRWLLFCLCDYGCFPVFRESSDLYLMDLDVARRTGRYEYHPIEDNSAASESWHSWSGNGRWIVFSSKRDYGLFTKPYLCHVDEDGRTGKAFVLPQKDPDLYESCLESYNTPELVADPVRITGERLARIVRQPAADVSMPMPMTGATPAAPSAAKPHE